jgi:hypothetical protein
MGLARICIYTLHTFSQERDFAIQLNKPFSNSGKFSVVASMLPLFSGCWADFFILALHLVISTSAKTPLVSFHGVY